MNHPIVCDGEWNSNNGKYVISSMSSIYNELLNHIHLVEDYKSDLIVDIKCLEKAIDSIKDGETIERWIGFRDSGVDHLEYIYSTIFTGAIFGGKREMKSQAYYYYRKLFKLTLKAEGDKITATLEKKSISDFVNEYNNKEPKNYNK